MIDEITDEALLRRYVEEGDIKAFELIVHRHRKALFNFIFRFTGQREKSEDLLQEVLVKLAVRAGEFEGRSRVRTWLFTIARNLSVDELRRAKHRNALSLDTPVKDDSTHSLIDRIKSGESQPDRSAASSMLKPLLVEAIESLPEDQREVFVLREYAGIPFAQIAEMVGAGLNTVKSRMRYALAGLRDYLRSRGIDGDMEHDASEGGNVEARIT